MVSLRGEKGKGVAGKCKSMAGSRGGYLYLYD